MILETLNELSMPHPQEEKNQRQTPAKIQEPKVQEFQSIEQNSMPNITPNLTIPPTQSLSQQNTPNTLSIREECEFLELLQERLLVLFEGLNAPQNRNIESRLNITINFLEYQLSVLQRRLEELKR